MKRNIAQYIICLCLLVPLFLSGQSSENSSLRIAQELYDKGRITQAIDVLEGSEDTLGTPQRWELLAKLYLKQEHTSKAVKYYTLLAQHDTINSQYVRKLAHLYQKSNLLNEAQRYYQKAYELDSLDMLSLGGLIDIALAQDDMPTADSLLSIGLMVDSAYTKLLYQKTRIDFYYRRYPSVLSVYDRLAQQQDLSRKHLKKRGIAFLHLDSLDLAQQYLLQSLDPEHPDPSTYHYLSIAAERNNDIEAAELYAQRCIKTAFGENQVLYLTNAARLKESSSKRNAIELYKIAEHFSPNADVLYKLATLSDLYYKDKSIAITYYQRFINRASTHDTRLSYARERMQYLKNIHFMNRR